MRNAHKILVEKPEGKIPLERPRRRWKDSIRIDFRGTGCGVVDWINLAQDMDQWGLLWTWYEAS